MVCGLVWVGSSQKDFLTFPEEVKEGLSDGLYLAQKGGKAANAKPLKGFLGASVLGIIERDRSGNLSLCLCRQVPCRCVCLTCVSKEVS